MANITVTPAGSITLCKTKLENDYKNTFTFASLSAQTTYFNGLTGNKNIGTDYTYMKKDGKIRVGVNVDEIIDYNYCFYNNSGFTTKRYYCFITRMEYVNENCTDVYIETDVFQTWCFSLQWNRCFVEREHVNNDTVGANTYPEEIETGEYVGNGEKYYNTKMMSLVFLMQVSQWQNGTVVQSTPVGGLPQAGGFYVFDGDSTGETQMDQVIAAYGTGFNDAVQNVYIVPKFTTNVTSPITSHQWNGTLSPMTVTDTVNMPTTLNGYTPRNNKLLCYPYQYIVLHNNNGSSNILKYELSSNTNHAMVFNISGVPTVGGSILCRPAYYNGMVLNDEEGVEAGKFPTLSWSEDAYTNWLTQNSVNIASALAGDAATTIMGGAMVHSGMTIGGSGNIASGVTGIANTLGTIYQHSLVPHSLKGNVNGGDLLTSEGSNTFFYDRKSIKAEMAAKIDGYFDMFGYKVCNVKIPNITGRSQWNYIKTIDCNVDGDIPQEDLETIRRACNAGITFWHTPANIYNYSLSNSIVT